MVGAILRMAVLHYTRTFGRGSLASLALHEVYEPCIALVAGDLEAKEIKLSWPRLEALIAEEEARMQEMRLKMMWDDFEAQPAGSEAGRRVVAKDAATEYFMSAEAVFKRMLEALEREGDAAAGARKPRRKGAGKLRGAGMATRLAVAGAHKRVT